MLSVGDATNLSITLLVLVIEWLSRSVARVLRFCLPEAALRKLDERVERALSTVLRNRAPPDAKRDMDSAELIETFGYPVEIYTVETEDGYLITMQRIPHGRLTGAKRPKQRSTPVLIMHGFLECSEVWLARGPGRGLPYMLADCGYDVWLGNTRGNRYGSKHRKLRTDTYEFWRFSLDEMIAYDLPAQIQTMLRISQKERFAYVGFSQGTALGFGLFSSNMELAARAVAFVAMAPAALVTGVKMAFVDTLMRCDPNIIYLLFGRRRLVALSIFWRAVLPQATFSRLIDLSTRHLFGWHSRNIAEEEKNVLYGHLYSLGSVRTMVHWFQMIARGRFQMYDDEPHRGRNYPAQIPPEYPIRQIRVRTSLFYGGSDSLCNMDWLLNELRNTLYYAECVKEYEHLDFQFAATSHVRVYPKVISILMTAEREASAASNHKAANGGH